MKVAMFPRVTQGEESGIKRVIEAYTKYLPQYGVEFVAPELAELKAIHAGSMDVAAGETIVALVHGLYWTADYQAPHFEYRTNQKVINSMIHAAEMIVPSAWVNEAIQRDMRRSAHVIPHGIEADEWHNEGDEGYVLWNKNRPGDVCSPQAVNWLAEKLPQQKFISTFAPAPAPNITITGVLPHAQMKDLIQRCGVYLVTSKETFCVGALEAMASGKPVLYYAHGSVPDLVPHGVAGYGAQPGNRDDLLQGLAYCLKYRKVLGANGQELVRRYTWASACERVAHVFGQALQPKPQTVSIVVPCYNKAKTVGRAIESALRQTYPGEVIVIDDGSTDSSWAEIGRYDVKKVQTENMGVAAARNTGWQMAHGEYICFLDADDALDPGFIQSLIGEIAGDVSLGAVYTGIKNVYSGGRTEVSSWPGAWDYDQQLAGHNQIPTCALIRRSALVALGGYRSCYAPGKKCGFEDGDLYLRLGAYGWRAKQVTPAPLFLYSKGSGEIGSLSRPQMQAFQAEELAHYRVTYPWYTDQQHPFASAATPTLMSHPVRQYDEPTISVTIYGTEPELLALTLDSLEAQTFRRWEAITEVELMAYPYTRPAPRTKLILEMQAGDRLEPHALAYLLDVWTDTGWNVVTKLDAAWLTLRGGSDEYCLLNGYLFKVGPRSVTVGCPTCGHERTVKGNVRVQHTAAVVLDDNDYAWVVWRGSEGPLQGPQTKTKYGWRQPDERFLAHRQDITAWGNLVGVDRPTTAPNIEPPPPPKRGKK